MIKTILPYAVLIGVATFAIGCASYPDPNISDPDVVGPTVSDNMNLTTNEQMEGEEPQVDPDTGQLEVNTNAAVNANY